MRLVRILGANVRRLRKAQGLSQEELAAQVGIDMRYLGGIERGQENPSLDVMERIARMLNSKVIALLSDSE
ncbi:MAG TPA: helix-turn-helix transcriptional regulator [Rhizomicrobium sp.]|nr:helix-turn-helix transcriptional regulator [Rhizomicrobium sp.]